MGGKGDNIDIALRNWYMGVMPVPPASMPVETGRDETQWERCRVLGETQGVAWCMGVMSVPPAIMGVEKVRKV